MAEVSNPVPVDIDIHESRITYTTKEILAKIDGRFENLERIAESAATRDEVARAVERIDKLERDSEGTKAVATALLNSGKDRFTRNEKMIGLALASVAVMPSVLSIIELLR